jgi:Mg/Co/Ni transporter MgtE
MPADERTDLFKHFDQGLKNALLPALAQAEREDIRKRVFWLVGMSLPFVLNRMGFDPASASAPLITSICDASGVVIYLFIASRFLALG